jgi:hypothetical protein
LSAIRSIAVGHLREARQQLVGGVLGEALVRKDEIDRRDDDERQQREQDVVPHRREQPARRRSPLGAAMTATRA